MISGAFCLVEDIHHELTFSAVIYHLVEDIFGCLTLLWVSNDGLHKPEFLDCE